MLVDDDSLGEPPATRIFLQSNGIESISCEGGEFTSAGSAGIVSGRISGMGQRDGFGGRGCIFVEYRGH